MDSLPLDTLDLPIIYRPTRDLAYSPEFRVLYCHQCKQVCIRSSLYMHLFEIHKIKAAIRRPIVEFCQTLDLVNAAPNLELI